MNETTPLVSVITSSYNHGKYISDAIESVVKQTYKNIEYFVIDDGSTDISVEIIEKLRIKYSSTCVINFEIQENKGLASVMNKLVAKCKGKYIALLESDDVWTLDKVEKQVAYLENNPDVAVCGGNVIWIDERNEVMRAVDQTPQKYTVYNLKNIVDFKYQIFSSTVMMRREIYDLMGTFDESLLYVDAYQWFKITDNGYSIVVLPYHFGYYRLHETNVHYNSLLMYQTLVRIIDKFKNHPSYSTCRRNMLWFIFPFLAINNKTEALSILTMAFRFDWRTIKGLIVLFVPYSLIKAYTKTRFK